MGFDQCGNINDYLISKEFLGKNYQNYTTFPRDVREPCSFNKIHHIQLSNAMKSLP